MSYTIEFDRQFIRSTRGITPVWLCGDSSVTIGWGREEKVARDWTVFLDILDVTREEFLERVKPILGSNEHWRKNGKWVDDAALLKWVENGCRRALSVEDIIACNIFDSIDCSVVVYEPGARKVCLEAQVSDTFLFDVWLDQAKEEIKRQKRAGNNAYPSIRFNWGERIVHSTQAGKKDSEQVLIKKKNDYLVNATSSSSSWTRDISKAKVMSVAEAKKLMEKCGFLMTGARFISAKVKNEPRNLVVIITKGRLAGRYLNKLTSTKLYHCPTSTSARKYSTRSAAQRAANRVMELYKGDTVCEVEEYMGENK